MLIKDQTGTWVPAARRGYGNEAELQALIADAPSLLPRVDEGVTVRELPLLTGPVDVVCVDSGGSITVVECKLGHNTDARRKVVAQLLDYAAALWQLSYDELDAKWNGRTGQPLAQAISAIADEDFDPVEFRQNVADSLAAGAFNLVIVTDRISDELSSLVDFINVQATGGLEVVLLELGYVRHEGVEMLLPRTHGPTDQPQSDRTNRTAWTAERAVQGLRERADDHERTLVDQLVQRGREVEAVHCGKGRTPSASGYATVAGHWKALWAVKVSGGDLTLKINRKSYRDALGDAAGNALDQTLSSLPTLQDATKEIQDWPDNRNVHVPLAALDTGTVTAVLDQLYAHVDGG